MTHVSAGTPAPQNPLETVLADLDQLEQTDLSGQVEIYERMHSALVAALTTTVEQPTPGTGGQ